MNESRAITVPLQAVRVMLPCDQCENGWCESLPYDISLKWQRYKHECTECGAISHETTPYPYVDFELAEIDEDERSEDTDSRDSLPGEFSDDLQFAGHETIQRESELPVDTSGEVLHEGPSSPSGGHGDTEVPSAEEVPETLGDTANSPRD